MRADELLQDSERRSTQIGQMIPSSKMSAHWIMTKYGNTTDEAQEKELIRNGETARAVQKIGEGYSATEERSRSRERNSREYIV